MGGVGERIRSGALVRSGAYSGEDVARAAETVAAVEADGIETVRMVFADPHGILRGKTITAEALTDAFASGIRATSTLLLKDVSHRTVFPVWSESGDAPMRGASDLLLVPVPDTFRRLPWSPHSAFLHCDVATPSGEPVPFASRRVLRAACDRLSERHLRAVMGLEVEFQVFEVTDPAREHADTTMPGRPPATRALNQGYQYLTETRYGESEALLDTIRRAAQSMGMPVRSVEIEMGPSQFEFTFAPGDPVTIADMAVTFRTMVKEVCHREGLLASFMARPRLPNAASNGWHIHQSVTDPNGRNLFTSGADGAMTPTASGWIAGLLRHAAASCIATTPTVNGYKRYTAYQLAPNRIGWGEDNRGAMLRALLAPGDPASRVENRVADSTANPYFALAFQIHSGLDGLENGLTPPLPLASPYDDAAAERLPASLLAAIERFEASELYRTALGDEFVSYLTRLKRAEWDRYLMTISEWEHAEYFTAF